MSNVKAGTRFVFEGKAGPAGAPGGAPSYAFSPDDDHYAYIWTDPTPGNRVQKLVVDGKPGVVYRERASVERGQQASVYKSHGPGGGECGTSCKTASR
jgi:hypothetical protein